LNGHGGTHTSGPGLDFLTGLLGLPTAVVKALQRGQEYLAIRMAIAGGRRDANTLTNMVFFARHAERRGKKLVKGEPGYQRLAGEWLDIRDRLVKPALQALPSTGAPSGDAPARPGSAPAIGGPREPAGYRVVYRTIKGRRLKRGLARYGGGRLDQTLRDLRHRGILQVTDEEIDLFQRIANVETSGLIQGLNTWDSAVVSIGFMQWTLLYGELQEWISRAPAAFRRYGIELEPSRTYTWKSGRQKAIVGAATADELRWDGWAQRFYLAGLDPDIIAAEVQLARQVLQRHLDGLRRRLKSRGMQADYSLFLRHYRQSPAIRGLFQEAYNNLPAAALNGTLAALRAAKAQGNVGTERFLAILQGAIRQAYLDRHDNGENVIRKTLSGAQ
jgi:hypothetical protein